VDVLKNTGTAFFMRDEEVEYLKTPETAFFVYDGILLKLTMISRKFVPGKSSGLLYERFCYSEANMTLSASEIKANEVTKYEKLGKQAAILSRVNKDTRYLLFFIVVGYAIVFELLDGIAIFFIWLAKLVKKQDKKALTVVLRILFLVVLIKAVLIVLGFRFASSWGVLVIFEFILKFSLIFLFSFLKGKNPTIMHKICNIQITFFATVLIMEMAVFPLMLL
jgi:hypothetical protein